MGLFESIKNIFVIPEDEEYDEEETAEKVETKKKPEQNDGYTPKRSEQAPRVVGGSKTRRSPLIPRKCRWFS